MGCFTGVSASALPQAADAPGRGGRGRRRGLATEVEQLVLQPAEDVVELAARGGVRVVRRELGLVGGARHADRGVQLVDGAVGFDPRAVFSDPLAADEVGLAAIAAARVDARDPDRHAASPSVARRASLPPRAPARRVRRPGSARRARDGCAPTVSRYAAVPAGVAPRGVTPAVLRASGAWDRPSG